MKNLKRIFNLAVFGLIIMFLTITTTQALTIKEQIANRELIIKSVPITNSAEFGIVDDNLRSEYDTDEYKYALMENYCSADYSTCVIAEINYTTARPSSNWYEVSMNYVYDENTKTKVDAVLSNIPANGNYELNEIESIEYFNDIENYYNDNENRNNPNPMQYSQEFRNVFGDVNANYEPNEKGNTKYVTYNKGITSIVNGDTLYGARDNIGVVISKILYVDDNETNIEKALEDKLSKYFTGVKVEKNTNSNVQNEYNTAITNKRTQLNACKTAKEQSDFTAYQDNNCVEFGQMWITDYSDIDSMFNDYESTYWFFANDAEQNTYNVTFDGKTMEFVVVKDSNKSTKDKITLTYKDPQTDITLKTNANIPFDSIMETTNITSGEEYDKVKNAINKDELALYNIDLFSNTNNKHVNELENGTYEIKLPISENLKGKNLAAYYVDAEGKVEEIAVTIEDNYVVFKTNHLGTFAIAEATKTTSSTSTTDGITNPSTGDTITNYVVMLTISAIGIAATYKVYKKLAK